MKTENLKTLIYQKGVTMYQHSLAIQEFEKLVQSNKEANELIIDVADLLGIDTDGFDIHLSIADFKEAINNYVMELIPTEAEITEIEGYYYTGDIIGPDWKCGVTWAKNEILGKL